MKDWSRPALLGGVPAFATRLSVARPSLPPLDPLLEQARRLLESGQLTNGRHTRELERLAAERLKVPECVAVSSCTLGLTLVLKALALEGELILPSFNFFAAGHAAVWNRLTPVFADCEPGSLTVDPSDVERLIGPRTSAILAVHTFGNPANAEALEQIASRHRIRLIFDAAHAFGSRRDGIPVGGFGHAEVFSLSPTKLLVAGEGGLIATSDRRLAARLRAARNYGDAGNYDPELLGLNARLAEFNALLAIHGLAHVDAQIARRNALAERFRAALGALPGLSFQAVRPGDVSTYKDFAVLVDAARFGLTRDELALALLAENIEVRKYFDPPLHRQRLYRRFGSPFRHRLAVTERVSRSVLSLPIYAALSDAQAGEMMEAIARIHASRESIAAVLRRGAREAAAP